MKSDTLNFIKSFKIPFGRIDTGMRFMHEGTKFIVHAADELTVSYSTFTNAAEIHQISLRDFKNMISKKEIQPTSFTLDNSGGISGAQT